MAKVKDQVFDGSEESYTDAGGEVHYLGELFRQAVTDSYPLPSLNPVGVTRKSPRTRRQTQQGRGSPAQAPWRECFQQCADRWNEMPDEDPEVGTCPEVSSKARVWEAKQNQGVMCSYFDLYMACCLSHCTQITITGPGGVSFKSGTIPAEEPCWPNPSPCKDSTLSIGHTSQQMSVNDSQALVAHDSEFGDGVPCCPMGDLSWEIIEGAGELDMDSGQGVQYTAPESNEGCANNPTIKVTDCCGRVAELKIAINADDGEEAAYSIDDGTCTIICNATPPGYGQLCDAFMGYKRRFYTCAGTHIPALDVWYLSSYVATVLGSCGDDGYCQIVAQEWCNQNDGEDVLSDLRTEIQMEAGCCPAAFL